jgi:hypothetical protein
MQETTLLDAKLILRGKLHPGEALLVDSNAQHVRVTCCFTIFYSATHSIPDRPRERLWPSRNFPEILSARATAKPFHDVWERNLRTFSVLLKRYNFF